MWTGFLSHLILRMNCMHLIIPLWIYQVVYGLATPHTAMGVIPPIANHIIIFIGKEADPPDLPFRQIKIINLPVVTLVVPIQ